MKGVKLMAKIGLDIGHGQNTFPPSKGVYKNGKGYAEHSFNAKLGMAIKKLLEKQGHKVILGQQPYKNDVPLVTRTNLYNRERVDLVVSIHANWNSNPNVNGRCIFYWGTSSRSKALAVAVRDAIKAKGYSLHGNGLHAGKIGSWTNLHINRETNMPTILVEHGFMSGNKDFDLIFGSKQNEYIQDMAEANVRGIQKWLGLSFKASTPKKVGWIKNNTGWWWRNKNGSYPNNEWKYINNEWYWFNSAGYMLTGWQKIKGDWFYLDSSGAMLSGWQELRGKWYYLNSNGRMRTGWNKLGDSWFFMDESGHMQTGWTKVGGIWYYMDSEGRMQTGWELVGGKWYYMNSNGHMQTGWLKLGPNWFYLNSRGEMQEGLTTVAGKHYFLQRNGVLITDEVIELEANKQGHLK